MTDLSAIARRATGGAITQPWTKYPAHFSLPAKPQIFHFRSQPPATDLSKMLREIILEVPLCGQAIQWAGDFLLRISPIQRTKRHPIHRQSMTKIKPAT